MPGPKKPAVKAASKNTGALTLEFATSPLLSTPVDTLIVPVCASSKETQLVLTETLKTLDTALQGMLKTAAAEEGFNGGDGKLLVLRKTPADKLKARRVILLGLGKASKHSPKTLIQAFEKAIASGLKLEGYYSAGIVLTDKALKLEEAVYAAVNGVFQATYCSQEAKDEARKTAESLKSVLLLLDKPASGELKTTLQEAIIYAQATRFAKDLVNKPANLKSTQTLVDAAKTLAKLPGLSLQVQDNIKWLEKEMPCFFEVARGALASDPPKFMMLSYKPTPADSKTSSKATTKNRLKLALVGKSVIFDTGGYQVKPDNFMLTMKGDMTGGAMVLGTMKALAALQPSHVEVTAYLAATPNKIDSNAMLPDTIVGTTCGKKVEIRHTDAEGRLTLIDAVAKAAEGKPDMILTIATLTGSASRAVGQAIALMGNNEAWQQQVFQAAQAVGDPIQPLAVIDEDYRDIDSKLDGADIINTSHNKNRGAQSAAAFVMTGAPEGQAMVHLDIAGADMTGDEKATGIAQKTLIRFVMEAHM